MPRTAAIAGSPWARLLDGNARWIEGRSTADGDRGAARRAEISRSQAPFAVVVGCSDSRVPAEILFDQGLGDLFVVRAAGHVVDSAALGSVEYAVEILGVSLMVVLSHAECGAIATATRVVDEAWVPVGYIRDIAERIAPNVLRARNAGATTANAIGGQHAIYTIELLRQRSLIVNDSVRRGALTAVSAQYCLGSGIVTEVHPLTGPETTDEVTAPGLLALTGA